MRKQFLIFLLLTNLILACENGNIKGNADKNDTTKKAVSAIHSGENWAYRNEQESLHGIKQVCNRLALYDIEKDSSDYELRMWLIPSMWDPSILYILKRNGQAWTLFHYQYYTLQASDLKLNAETPVIDSVVMESLKPQKVSWTTYINNLKLDSLWNVQTESSIKGKQFGVVDGHRYILEFNEKGRYKYLFYTVPEYFQEKDINHKKFIEFKSRLVDPIIYNGMRNP